MKNYWKAFALTLIVLNGLALCLGVWATQTEQGQQFTFKEISRGVRYNLSQRPLYYARYGLDGEFSWFGKGCVMLRNDQVEPVITILGAISNEWLTYEHIEMGIHKSGVQFSFTPVNLSFCLSGLPSLYVVGDPKGPEVPTFDPEAWQNNRAWTQNGTVKPGTACQRPENQVRAGGWHMTINSQGIVGAAPCSPVEPPSGS